MLNPYGIPDDAVYCSFRLRALAEILVLLFQTYLVRHAAQEKPQLIEWSERFGDVVVGAQLHRLNGGFDGAVPSHQRDFGAGQQAFYLLQKLQSRHARHDHVCQHHVGGLLFKQSQRGFTALRFAARKAERLTDCHAELADTLLVVHHQQPDSELLIHDARPIVFSTTEINCCTRNGFSTQGAPVFWRVATVSSLAISPVMKTTFEASSGRWSAIQAWTCAPSTPPGVRMSDTMP